MLNIHIYGLEKPKAKIAENRIFKILESDDNPDLDDVVTTIHARTTVRDSERNESPYILIAGDHLDGLKMVAKELKALEMDIEVQKIDAFYPKESCR